MIRLRATLVASLACLAVLPAVANGAAPTTPRDVSATVVASGLRPALVDVTWTSSIDVDGDPVTYEVQVREDDAISTATASTASTRLTLLRGRTYAISVLAVDATGARSTASEGVTVTALSIPVSLSLGIRRGTGLAQSCAGVRRACRVTGLAGLDVAVRARSTARLTDARVLLTVLWRRPGTTRFVVRPVTIAGISTGSASIPLARIVRAPGTWCMRARLAPNSGELRLGRTAFAPTCVRYVSPAR